MSISRAKGLRKWLWSQKSYRNIRVHTMSDKYLQYTSQAEMLCIWIAEWYSTIDVKNNYPAWNTLFFIFWSVCTAATCFGQSVWPSVRSLKLNLHSAMSYNSLLTHVCHRTFNTFIQGVTGGTDQTSGECSLGHTIPI